jgi:glutamine amidotransferase
MILKADRVVFPGQGAARDCMRELETRGMAEVVREVIQTKPFLGICMGMQVLMQHSEENSGIECLGLYEGNVRYFGTVHQEIGVRLKIPQMGCGKALPMAHASISFTAIMSSRSRRT